MDRTLRELCAGQRVCQLFGGLAKFGTRLDIDRTVRPDVLGDAWLPPFRKDAFDVVILDPPYVSINQQMKQQLLRGAAYIATRHVIWFHTMWIAGDAGCQMERAWLVRHEKPEDTHLEGTYCELCEKAERERVKKYLEEERDRLKALSSKDSSVFTDADEQLAKVEEQLAALEGTKEAEQPPSGGAGETCPACQSAATQRLAGDPEAPPAFGCDACGAMWSTAPDGVHYIRGPQKDLEDAARGIVLTDGD